MTKLSPRERYVRSMTGRDVDRPMYFLFWGPWASTWRRWQKEGMTFDSFSQVISHFGADPLRNNVPINAGPCPAFERTILEQTDEWEVFIDTWGIRRRNFRASESMSEFIEFPIKNWDDWRKYKAERLDPHHPGRLAGPWRDKCRQWMQDEQIIRLGYFPDVGIFGSIRWLLGDEECLVSFYTQPDLVRDMMNHMTDIYVTVFEAVASEVRVDEIHIWEDMSGRQGPLISPAHWEEFMGPCYRRIRDVARRHDIPLISVDTDGNPDLIVPPMQNNGVNMLFPLEVAAGCDINQFQARYPQMAFLGGIDKRALAVGPAAIDAELARIAPAVRNGRYIPALDHLVPDDVSWENYCHYARSLARLVGAG